MTRATRFARDDRGASNVIGHVLLFAVVTLSVTAVFVGAVSDVQDRRDAATFSTTTSDVTRLADAVEAVHTGSSPGAETSVSLGGAQLSPDDTLTVTVEVDSGSGTTVRSIRSTPVVVETSDDRRVLYAAGVVHQSVPGGSGVVERDAPVTVVKGQVVIELVNVTMRDTETVAGSEAVLSGDAERRVTTFTTGEGRTGVSETVTVTVAGPGADAWRDSLLSNGFILDESAVQTDTRTTVTRPVDSVAIRTVNVTVTTES
jgi:hypothetical protein